MEYVLGSLITLLILGISSKALKVKELAKPLKVKTRFNQSRKMELLLLVMPYLPPQSKPLITQATKLNSKNLTTVMFLDNKAYWVEEGLLHEADFADGHVDMDSKKRVDIMSMNDVELKKMQFVVEKLTEGKVNDSGNSGQS